MFTAKYFKVSEFKCNCCGSLVIDEKFLLKLDSARSLAGIPFVITSGYRCRSHNKNVGGNPNSSHRLGSAADIYCANNFDRFLIINSLIKSGFIHFGIANNFIHVDDLKINSCFLYL